MTMYERFRGEGLRRIESDFGLQQMSGTNYMRKGTCPAPGCGKRTLCTFHDSPWMLICGRPEKCGHRVHVKDLYSDLLKDWSKQAPSTGDDPTATARAYLEMARGFRIELIAGWFTQVNYWSRDISAGSATVRFPLDKGGYWERLSEPQATSSSCGCTGYPYRSYRQKPSTTAQPGRRASAGCAAE